MNKIVLDADATIKLARAGILSTLTKGFKLIISEAAYKEVLRGKEKLYEDAFIVGDLFKDKKLNVINIKGQTIIGLGLGESTTLELFKKIKGDVIVSDDKKFLSVLEREDIPFIVSTDMIVLATKKGVISKQEALKSLTKIKPFVNEDIYNTSRKLIGGN